MKKVFLLALLAAGTTAGHAQGIKAGTVSLGGGIGYSTSTSKSEYKPTSGSTYTSEYTQNTFQFSPAVGYFFADNLAIGLNLNYAASKSTISNSGPGATSPAALDASTVLRVGPYVQYYKMLTEQFGVLGTFGVGYQHSFTPNYNGSNRVVDTKANGFYAAVTPGVIFFPVPKFGISASIGYLGYDRVDVKHSDDVDGESGSNSAFGANFGFSQLQFGGTYYFGR